MAAPKGNKNAAGNPGGARPSLFKPEYVEWAEKFALLGATDKDLASVFEVSLSTIEAWKRDKVEFLNALKRGKMTADANVAAKLYHRAMGYSHKAVKISSSPDGKEHITEYMERYPPDTTAAIFWLKNRRPDLWRDKVHQEISVDQTLAERLARARERAG